MNLFEQLFNEDDKDVEVIECDYEEEDASDIIDEFWNFILDNDLDEDDIRDVLVQLYAYAYLNGVKQSLMEDIESKMDLLNGINRNNIYGQKK